GSRRRCAAGDGTRWSSSRSRHETAAQADSEERPRARRALTMLRPARVRIRARKPCFLWRRRLFGWNVRLLIGSPRSWARTCPSRWSEGLLHERVFGRTRWCGAAAEVTDPKPERGPQWTREPHRDGAQRRLHDFKGDTSGGQRQPSRIGWMWPDSHVSPPSSAAPRCFCAGYDVGRTGALWLCPQQ